MIKLRQERRARLAGRVAEADLYVRQLTWLEVVVDVGTGDGMRVFQDLRLGGYDLVHIAETPMSRLLGRVRRAHWAEAGEPDRPEPPAEDYLEHHHGFSTEPPEATRGGVELSYAEQQQRYEERHAREADALLAWEEQAREQAAQWRERINTSSHDGPGEETREEPEGPMP
jgi:hypothetical protein